MANGRNLLIKSRIPSRTHIHVVVHEQHIFRCHQRAKTIKGIAHTYILIRMRIFNIALRLDPRQSAITTIIDMNQYLMIYG